MIDIETKGKRADTVVLSIGAVRFDPYSNAEITDTLYLHPNLDQQDLMGRTCDPATMEWWDKQNSMVKNEAFMTEGRLPVGEVLTKLSEFCMDADAIWSQGPQFDMVILEDLYRSLSIKKPWRYNQVRDSRTLFAVLGDRRMKDSADAHNALMDAVSQAWAVQQCMLRYRDVLSLWKLTYGEKDS